MTAYEIVAAIIGVILAFLFMVYARTNWNAGNKKNSKSDFRNPSRPEPESSPAKTDIISQAAGGIFKAHAIFNKILGIIIVAVVLTDAFYDRLTRIIVLSTIDIMMLIVLFSLVRRKRK